MKFHWLYVSVATLTNISTMANLLKIKFSVYSIDDAKKTKQRYLMIIFRVSPYHQKQLMKYFNIFKDYTRIRIKNRNNLFNRYTAIFLENAIWLGNYLHMQAH